MDAVQFPICILQFSITGINLAHGLNPSITLLPSAEVGYNKNSNLRPPGAFNE